jgi:hypothetical protein
MGRVGVCERCKTVHTEDELNELMRGWLKVYSRQPELAARADALARLQLEKHTPKVSEPPWHVKLGVRILGGKEMLAKLLAAWEWVDGKKTAIGAALVLVSDLLGVLALSLGPVLEGFGLEAVAVASVLAFVGKGAAAIGLVHKFFKKFFLKGN